MKHSLHVFNQRFAMREEGAIHLEETKEITKFDKRGEILKKNGQNLSDLETI